MWDIDTRRVRRRDVDDREGVIDRDPKTLSEIIELPDVEKEIGVLLGAVEIGGLVAAIRADLRMQRVRRLSDDAAVVPKRREVNGTSNE